MRIAQIAPLAESVPPQLYGGTERVVSFLTEELVAMGHDVTLFASGDSRTKATLVPGCARALRLDPSCRDPAAYHVAMVEQVLRRRDEFDVIHNHIDYLPMPLLSRQATPSLTTLHGRLDWPEFAHIYRLFRELPVVSISDTQRRPLRWMNWIGTVHHGLPEGLLRPRTARGDYLAFLGRISPEKGADAAIRIAISADVPLKIAAKVDRADRAYFEAVVEPLLDHPLVEYIGEISDREKAAFLGDARALLFPIDWPEPFGVVLIEAMACGTPVIAFRRGSVPEVVENGVTGFIVGSDAEAVDAVDRVGSLDRSRVRREFERRFTSRRMAQDYVRLYEFLAETEPSPLLAAQG